jgi:hypothetical protein
MSNPENDQGEGMVAFGSSLAGAAVWLDGETSGAAYAPIRDLVMSEI